MLSKTYRIQRLDNGVLSAVDDTVICEYNLVVNVDGAETATLLCSPAMLEELVLGHLFCAGTIDSCADIASLDICAASAMARVMLMPKQGVKHKQEGGNLPPSGQPQLTDAQILDLAHIFSKKSALFNQTGGVHSAAICGADGILCFAEDISRQNAVHKVLGTALKNNLNCGDKMMLTSCRISSEIIAKVIRGCFPLLVSLSAPTDAAIDLAQQQGLRLIGFARGHRMNIYS